MMSYRGILLVAAVASAGLVQPSGADPSNAARYIRTVGRWTVAGDPATFGCIAFGPTDRMTKLVIAVTPKRSDYAFALSNPAWRSIVDGGKLTITAVFIGADKRATDAWSLSSNGVNGEGKGPAFHFFIERSANDNTSFRQQFARASRVIFSRDRIPIASFELNDSAAVLDDLDECRAELRADPSFDPFSE